MDIMPMWTAELKARKERAKIELDILTSKHVERQFAGVGGGFDYTIGMWDEAARTHDEAIQHCLEAFRRQAVCRLAGATREATEWYETAGWFRAKFKITDGEINGNQPQGDETPSGLA